MSNIIKVQPNLAKLVDRLGYLSSEQADLKTEADDIKATLRASGLQAIEGRLFRATVGEGTATRNIDWEAIARGFIPEATLNRLVAHNTKTGFREGSVRVVARKGGAK